MTTMHMKRPVLCLLTAVLLLGVVGCAGPRRVSPNETTRPELRNPRQLPVSLIEFREAATADILQELPVAPVISDTPGQVTILLGDINNKTTLMSTTEYEYVVSGIRSNLIRAKATRAKLRFVEERARVERIAVRERVATTPAPTDASIEEIKWAGGSYYVPDYDANTTYGLFMDVYQISRGKTNLYYIEAQLVHFATNQIVYSFQTETKQVSD